MVYPDDVARKADYQCITLNYKIKMNLEIELNKYNISHGIVKFLEGK